MVHRDCSTASIAQVWYSSVWNLDTAVEFQAACATLTAQCSSESDFGLTDAVRAFLAHWSSDELKVLNLEAARQAWLDSIHEEEGLNNLGHFKRKLDREELGVYALTGEFATDSSKGKCGSLASYN
eukprot:1780338-Rhodomonas_salina.1